MERSGSDGKGDFNLLPAQKFDRDSGARKRATWDSNRKHFKNGGSAGSNHVAKRVREHDPITPPSVFRNSPEPDRARELRAIKNQLLQCVYNRVIQHSEWRYNTLPGVCPKNMRHTNVKEIREGSWMVAPKSDGVRLIILIFDNKYWFFDRSFCITKSGDSTMKKLCCLDCEMVSAVEDQTPVLLVHDAYTTEGLNVSELSFDVRLKAAKKCVEALRHALDSYVLIVKTFVDATPGSIKSLEHSIHKMDLFMHGRVFREIKTDGLIFVKTDSAGHEQRAEKVLKWKPPDRCTVDFCVEDGSINLHHNDTLIPIAPYKNPLIQQGSIAEFGLASNGNWVLHCLRSDRNKPNSVAAAFQTLTFKQSALFLWDMLVGE